MIDGLGHALASWLLPMNLWTAALFLGAYLVDRALAQRTRAAFRIALYAPVALRILLPLTGLFRLAQAPHLALFAPVEIASDAMAASRDASFLAPTSALAIGYLTLALVLGVRKVHARVQMARALRAAPVVASIEAPCAVVRHEELGPMVVGVTKPRIVLPASILDEGGRGALAWVLRHEIAHVRRRDPWLSAGIDALLVVAWPVAPLWFAAGRVRRLIELACDEAALDGADAAQRRRYGHALLDLAERESFGMAGALHFGSGLRARIEALASARPWSRGIQVALVGAGVLAFVACSSVGPASSATADEQLDGKPGRLAPEVVQTVVRASFGSFRTCYENGLTANPKLAGQVSVGFTITEAGAVTDAIDHGSDMPDPQVVECIVAGFSKLTFPKPEGGAVTVIYPISFSP